LSDDEFSRLLEQVHKDVTNVDFNGKSIPCIIFAQKKFDEIMLKVAGKPFSIETNLNILDDRLGHVFVEILLNFSIEKIRERILLYANSSIDFFELLSKTSMFAISSENSEKWQENILMIQLPRPEKAKDALEKIRTGLQVR